MGLKQCDPDRDPRLQCRGSEGLFRNVYFYRVFWGDLNPSWFAPGSDLDPSRKYCEEDEY